MRLVTFTNLYPSPDMPRHGVFVRERLRHIVATGEATARAVALRPGVTMRQVARPADEDAIPVRYQPVPALPLVTNWIEPLLWASAAAPAVREAAGDDPSDAILDGHFLYPDGVAAVLIGRRLGLPVVLSARGSDVNVKCRNPVIRRWVRWAVAHCAAVITVSQALADALRDLKIHPTRLAVIPNGVDHATFRVHDREQCKQRWSVAGHVIASVGHLVSEKGHDIAIEALQDWPDTQLLIVGEGPERERLERQAAQRGVAARTHFLGLVPHADMGDVYGAADALVLPSVREGMPNVILESLACGTPVVATDVGGIGEVIRAPVAGSLMQERTAAALSDALAAVRQRGATPAEVQEYSKQFAWGPLVRRQLDLYASVLSGARASQDATIRS